jgi:arginyl-tRNA synthetase
MSALARSSARRESRAVGFCWAISSINARLQSTSSWRRILCSKLSGAAVNRDELESADYSVFEEEAYADVRRLLVQFPDIVKSSFSDLESSIILAYLFCITDLLPAVWDEEAEGSDPNVAQLTFYESVRQVLESGMRIVGLVPTKM